MVGPWGLGAFTIAAIGLGSASVLGVWLLTVGLALVAIGVAVAGAFFPEVNRKKKDRVWLWIGGVTGGLVLLVALFMPGLINNRWALDTSVAQADVNKVMVIPGYQIVAEGRPLGEDEWVDPTGEWIKQHDVMVRIDSAKVDTLPGKGTPCAVIRLGVMPSTDQTLRLDPLHTDKHPVVLKDEQGGSYTVAAERYRVRGKGGAPVFLQAKEMREVFGGLRQDLLLYFEPVPPRTAMLKLEVPCSAWGRQGVCRFRFPADFQAPVPTMKN
jgi:hypothetical protein